MYWGAHRRPCWTWPSIEPLTELVEMAGMKNSLPARNVCNSKNKKVYVCIDCELTVN